MSLAQQKTTAIVPKFSSSFSMVGSASIIWVCLRNKKERLDKTYHRLMLGMSVADFVSSGAWFLTTWPIPKGSPYVWGAKGNQQTCNAQGFFSQISMSVIMYNGFLSLYYLLVVKYKWKKKAVLKAERIFHFVSILVGVGTASAGMALTLYNNIYGNCWINGLPLDCIESWENAGQTTCVRGDNYTLFQWLFFYGPLWFVIIVVTISMTSVYRSSKQMENVLQRHSQGEANNKKHSNQILQQCFMYVVGFYVSWIPLTVLRIVQLIANNTPFWLIIVSYSTYPTQGAFNAIVYHRVSASHSPTLV